MGALVKHRAPAAIAIAAVLLFALSGVASAYSTAPGYAASDYATGFPESPTNHWGPIGVAFDQSDNLYVADAFDGNIYRFQPGGGTASDATRVTSSPIPGTISGLVVSKDGDIFVARYAAGDVVQVSPDTGQVIRTVASVPCATGLAIDPISGDLFVSENSCGSTIFRVSDYSSGPGTVSSYTTAPGVDGLAFDQSGTLYAESDGHVLEIAGTKDAFPGAITSVARVPHADGLAFGAHSSGQPSYLVANRNDGVVTRVDFSGDVPSQSDIFSGGSRGDFVAVDSRGCLYITQSTSIVQIKGSDSPCGLEPTTTGPAPAVRVIVATTVHRPAAKACTQIQSLRLSLRQQGRVRLRSATVYVNGRRVRQLGGGAVTKPFVLTHLPKSAFTVKVVAVTTSGAKLVSSKRYSNCAKPSPKPACVSTTRLTVRVPHPAGTRVVLVRAYVNGRRKAVVHGRRVTRLTLTRLPHARFTLKLVTRDARGRRGVSRQAFLGCAESAQPQPG
jgi:hypothetical protein